MTSKLQCTSAVQSTSCSHQSWDELCVKFTKLQKPLVLDSMSCRHSKLQGCDGRSAFLTTKEHDVIRNNLGLQAPTLCLECCLTKSVPQASDIWGPHLAVGYTCTAGCIAALKMCELVCAGVTRCMQASGVGLLWHNPSRLIAA